MVGRDILPDNGSRGHEGTFPNSRPRQDCGVRSNEATSLKNDPLRIGRKVSLQGVVFESNIDMGQDRNSFRESCVILENDLIRQVDKCVIADEAVVADF